MKKKYFRRHRLKFLILLFVILLILISFIPIRISMALQQNPEPQAIFVLGGDSQRMVFAGKFWHSYTDLDIWISDFPWNLESNLRIFHQAGVPNQQLHFDSKAKDTVTNFTTLVDDFLTQKFSHIYLITSDYHMRRSSAIATLVFGSRGIAVTAIPVKSNYQKQESLLRVVRDCARSLIWIIFGKTGASFNPRLQ